MRSSVPSLSKALAAALMLAIGIGVLAFGISRDEAANRDYISYWAAGHQLVHHQNPYDAASILTLQKAAGFHGNTPFFMRNPPTAFWVALPLGLLPSRGGAVLWTIVIVLSLMISLRLLWSLEGQPSDRLHLTGYLFPPALACIFNGQTGMLLLLGATLFLYLERGRPYVAGVALLVVALKPHLFLPFVAVLVLWSVFTRSYRVLLGAVSAVAASVALAWALDPHAWSEYAFMLQEQTIRTEPVPTLSVLLRNLVNPHGFWFQLLPCFLGVAWAIAYFLQRRERWSWQRNGPLLLLVSVLVAPYAWFTDETLALPAVLLALYKRSVEEKPLWGYACMAIPGLIAVFWPKISLHSRVFLWLAPAWLAWYLFAMARPRSAPEPGELAAALPSAKLQP